MGPVADSTGGDSRTNEVPLNGFYCKSTDGPPHDAFGPGDRGPYAFLRRRPPSGTVLLHRYAHAPRIRPTGSGADARPTSTVESAAGWPNLRGPDYRGVSAESDLADSWPPEGPPVLWTEELGRGYSSLAAAGNRVYTLGQTMTEQYLVAMDADTGRRIWEHRCGWPFDPAGMYPGPRATPTWCDGRIYFATPDGLVECLDDATGRALWSVNVNKKFAGRGTDFGYSCSPLLEQGKVILPVGGPGPSIVALDARTGETVWTSGDEPASYCTAMPITFRGAAKSSLFCRICSADSISKPAGCFGRFPIPRVTTNMPRCRCTRSRASWPRRLSSRRRHLRTAGNNARRFILSRTRSAAGRSKTRTAGV